MTEIKQFNTYFGGFTVRLSKRHYPEGQNFSSEIEKFRSEFVKNIKESPNESNN